jgi:hypothetical protein
MFSSISGHDPSRLFHRSVNKRYVPDYYDVIKEPMALSLLKQKINKKTYKNFSEFVRDCALVSECDCSLSGTIARRELTKGTHTSNRFHTMRKHIIDRSRKLMRMHS